MKSVVALLGRWCIAAIFIIAGASKILDWQGTEQNMMGGITEMLTHYQETLWLKDLLETTLSWAPMLLIIAVAIEIVCGVLIFIGFQVRLAALILALYLIPITLLFHHFWTFEGPDKNLQIAMFLKNLAIFGGLLLLVAHGKCTAGKTTSSEKNKGNASASS